MLCVELSVQSITFDHSELSRQSVLTQFKFRCKSITVSSHLAAELFMFYTIKQVILFSDNEEFSKLVLSYFVSSTNIELRCYNLLSL